MIVTGAGSLPGTDFRGAVAAMAEGLPELVPVPELPERGPHASMIGRALGLVDGIGVDLPPSGWRLTDHSDANHRRARATWRRDLDDLEELLQGATGGLKIAVAGPWTLAATVQRPRGDVVLADHGARRDLAQALEEGARTVVEDLRRRLPAMSVAVQVDEPSLVAVRRGAVPTASGLARHRAVDDEEIARTLAPWSDAVLHCCAPGRILDVVRRAGIRAVHVDASHADVDELGTWIDGGGALTLGVVDTAATRRQGVDELVDRARRVTRELGLGPWMSLAPACGMAAWAPADVTWQLGQLRRAATVLEGLHG